MPCLTAICKLVLSKICESLTVVETNLDLWVTTCPLSFEIVLIKSRFGSARLEEFKIMVETVGVTYAVFFLLSPHKAQGARMHSHTYSACLDTAVDGLGGMQWNEMERKGKKWRHDRFVLVLIKMSFGFFQH